MKQFIIVDNFAICKCNTNAADYYTVRSYLCKAAVPTEIDFQSIYNDVIQKIPNTLWYPYTETIHSQENELQLNNSIQSEYQFFIIHVHEKHSSCSSRSCYLLMNILKHGSDAYLHMNCDMRTYTLPGYPFEMIEQWLAKYTNRSFIITTDISCVIETLMIELFYATLIVNHCIKYNSVSISGVILGWVCADLNSNIVHNLMDNRVITFSGSDFEMTALMFHQHHLEPIGIRHENYVVQLTKSGKLTLALYVMSLLAPQTNFLSSFFITNGILSTHSHFIHRLAHMRTRGYYTHPIIKMLQDSHIISNHKIHKKHHIEHMEHYDHYSVVSGLWNNIMDKLPADDTAKLLQQMTSFVK